MKKYFIVLTVTIAAFLIFFFVKRGLSSPETVCNIALADVPKNAVFVELLIPKSDFKDHYTACNTEQCGKNGISTHSKIVEKNFDGYVSYTYHHKSSSSISELEKCDVVSEDGQKKMLQAIFWYDIKKKNIENCSSMMFAYIDGSGQVITTTNVINLNRLLVKSTVIIDGEKATVKYSGVKVSVTTAAFAVTVVVETAVFLIIKKRRQNA